MDKLFEGLLTGPFWVLVAIILIYILISNFDKIFPLLSKPNAIEKATRDVPALLERQKQLHEMGQKQLSRLVGVHISGVLSPKVKRIIEKEIEREVKRGQPARIKHRLLFIFLLYTGVLITYALVSMHYYVRITDEVQFAKDRPFLAFLALTVIFILGMMVIQRVYTALLRKSAKTINEEYNRAYDDWMDKHELVLYKALKKAESGDSDDEAPAREAI